jgi:hypothetical protein
MKNALACPYGDKLLTWPGALLNQNDFSASASQTTFIPDTIAFSADGNRGILGAKSGNEYLFTDIRAGQTGASLLLHPHLTNGPIRKMGSWGENGIAFITTNTLVTGPLISGDSNQDGIPDWWALDHGFDINSTIADADTDGDGSTDLAEYLAGTDPHDAADSPKMALFRRNNGTVRINFNVQTDQHYVLERTTHLSTPDWTTITNGVSSGGMLLFEDTPSDETGFYRIRFLR